MQVPLICEFEVHWGRLTRGNRIQDMMRLIIQNAGFPPAKFGVHSGCWSPETSETPADVTIYPSLMLVWSRIIWDYDDHQWSPMTRQNSFVNLFLLGDSTHPPQISKSIGTIITTEAFWKSPTRIISEFNGNFRILKWRYISTIFLAIWIFPEK